MKRMHLGLNVDDIEASVEFYTRFFGQPPTLHRGDYAKWMLDDPYINFNLNASGDREPGSISHLGLQVETNDELDEVRAEWDAKGFRRDDQNDLVCGYQLQDKSWVYDPQQMPWEVFVTHGVRDEYGTNEMPCPCE